MCELYSVTTNREAMRRISATLGHAIDERYAPQPLIRKHDEALILRNDGKQIGWGAARLGMPTPPEKLRPGARVDPGNANIASPWYPHWRQWLGPEHRCVIPATSFIEHNSVAETYAPIQFAFEGEPLFFFAGLWTSWTGTRRRDEGIRSMDLYAILTTEANGDIRPFHDRMPVILLNKQEVVTWLTAPASEALRLQQPLGDGSLRVVGPKVSA